MEPFALFAYGTLQHPTVLSYVLGCEGPEGAPAVLKDHVRFRIKDADYPGIFPRTGEAVDGTLFPDIPPAQWARLDHYESDLYERRQVIVVLEDGSTAEAFSYVLPPEHESVCTKEPWHLTQYIPPAQPE